MIPGVARYGLLVYIIYLINNVNVVIIRIRYPYVERACNSHSVREYPRRRPGINLYKSVILCCVNPSHRYTYYTCRKGDNKVKLSMKRSCGVWGVGYQVIQVYYHATS